MKFEKGKFYKNKAGVSISMIGEAKSHKLGDLFVVEESDLLCSISCVEKGAMINKDNSWHEISEAEWLTDFKNNHKCIYCEKGVESGETYRPTKHGVFHEGCFQKFLSENPDDE